MRDKKMMKRVRKRHGNGKTMKNNLSLSFFGEKIKDRIRDEISHNEKHRKRNQ
jgi:hypothetical protein